MFLYIYVLVSNPKRHGDTGVLTFFIIFALGIGNRKTPGFNWPCPGTVR